MLRAMAETTSNGVCPALPQRSSVFYSYAGRSVAYYLVGIESWQNDAGHAISDLAMHTFNCDHEKVDRAQYMQRSKLIKVKEFMLKRN